METRELQERPPAERVQVGALGEFDVSSIEHIYERSLERNLDDEFLSPSFLYAVATAYLPSSKRKIYIIDRQRRLHLGRNKVALRPLREIAGLVHAKDWYPPLKDVRDVSFLPLINDPNYTDIWEIIPAVNLKSYFEAVGGGWKDKVDLLFYQGYTKDARLVSIFKSIMLPLPIATRWQRYNSHAFIFCGSKTGKTSFFKNVLGYPAYSDPSGPGLLGGIIGKKAERGRLEGTGAAMLDEINTCDSLIFDALLNLMENGTAERGKIGVPSCSSTKTLVFSGNTVIDDVPVVLALEFQGLLASLSREGSNTERVSNRLGIFVFGGNYEKAHCVRHVNETEIDLIRGIIFDTLSDYSKEWEAFLASMEPWLNSLDEAWGESIKTLALKTRDARIMGFVRGWGSSTDNIRLGALRRTTLENLNRFVLEGGPSLAKDVLFLGELERNYAALKAINLESLNNILSTHVKTTPASFCHVVRSYPMIRTMGVKELMRLFNIGSSDTLHRWLARADEEEQRSAEAEDIPIEPEPQGGKLTAGRLMELVKCYLTRGEVDAMPQDQLIPFIAEEEGLEKAAVQKVLEDCLSQGDLYEPKHGFVATVKR